MTQSTQQPLGLSERMHEIEQAVNNLRTKIIEMREIIEDNSVPRNNDETSSERSDTNSASVAANRNHADVRIYLPLENNFVVVHAFGTCENKQETKSNARGAIGIWFSDGNPLNVAELVLGHVSSNIAAIQASTKALSIIKPLGSPNVKIVINSRYVIDNVKKWKDNFETSEWERTNVTHKEYIKKLLKLVKDFKEIKWEHISESGNKNASKLAKAALKTSV